MHNEELSLSIVNESSANTCIEYSTWAKLTINWLHFLRNARSEHCNNLQHRF